MWMMPESGYLSGIIIEVNDTNLQIEDFEGSNWIIDIIDSHIPPAVILDIGEKIKIIGRITDKKQFKA